MADWLIDDPVPTEEVEETSFDRPKWDALAEAVSTRPDGSKVWGTVCAFVGNYREEMEPSSFRGGKKVDSGEGDLKPTIKLDWLVAFSRRDGEVVTQAFQEPWVMTKTLVDHLRGRGLIVAGRVVGKRGSKGYEIEPVPPGMKANILKTLTENGWLPKDRPPVGAGDGGHYAPGDDDSF